MKVTRAGRQPCDPKYSRLAERIEALQAEIAALASELSVVSGSAGQAVVTAEDAQASAAASAAEAGTARTAAEAAADVAQGVSDRVTAAEAAIDDVQDYAEAIGDDVSALDTEIHTTRPYVDTNTAQTITAKKHIPTATAGDSSDVWVNKAFVQSTDGRNNLVHNIGNESIGGVKNCENLFTMAHTQRRVDGTGWQRLYHDDTFNHATLMLAIMSRREAHGCAILWIGGHLTVGCVCNYLVSNIVESRKADFAVSFSEGWGADIWQKNISATDTFAVNVISAQNNGIAGTSGFKATNDTFLYTVDENGFTDANGLYHAFTQWKVSE